MDQKQYLKKVITKHPQKPLGIPKSMNEKITYLKHITVKLLDSSDKGKILKVARRRERHITFKGGRVKLITGTGTQCSDTIKELRRKTANREFVT